jgi:hypothetical protein
MNIIVFWVIRKKGFRLKEFIIGLTVLGVSGILDNIFSDYYKLYYYIHYKHTIIYSKLLDIFLFPAMGVLFILLMPNPVKLKNSIRYCIIWIVSLFIFEILIIPLKIVQYTGWRIFPHSLIFYTVTIPIAYFYTLILSNYFKNHINN